MWRLLQNRKHEIHPDIILKSRPKFPHWRLWPSQKIVPGARVQNWRCICPVSDSCGNVAFVSPLKTLIILLPSAYPDEPKPRIQVFFQEKSCSHESYTTLSECIVRLSIFVSCFCSNVVDLKNACRVRWTYVQFRRLYLWRCLTQYT